MKAVKDLVDKEWAAQAKQILTGNPQDTTSLFTALHTITLAKTQALKSERARERFTLALQKLKDAIKFGWAHGINEQQSRFTRPEKNKPNRRVDALLPFAVAAGEAIGKAQAARIAKAHATRAPGTFPLRHTHAAPSA